MFSTPLGESRLQKVPESVLVYLRKMLRESGSDPDNFVMSTFWNDNQTNEDYSVMCKTCKHSYTQGLCDWRKDYGLDGLAKAMIDFTNDHRHGPQPVIDIAGSFPPAVAVYPQGYRKFRDV